MKKVILTGHSKGLGLSLAQGLLDRGVHVLGLSRSQAPLDCPQTSLDLSDGDSVIAWLDSGAMSHFLQDASEAWLINNAGMIDPIHRVGQQDPVAISRAVTANVTAPLLLSNGFIAASAALPSRKLVHISSGAGRKAYAGWSIYCATKAALDHHAACVVADGLASLKISSIAPGIIDTGMQSTIRSHSADQFPLIDKFQDYKANGDLISPEETAAKLLTYIESDQFGEAVLSDIRDI